MKIFLLLLALLAQSVPAWAGQVPDDDYDYVIGFFFNCGGRWASAERLQTYIEAGFDLNRLEPSSSGAANPIAWTCLMTAAHDQQLDIVRLLLESGANPNTTNANGITALELAVSPIHEPNKALQMATLLLDHGAAINQKTFGQATALSVVATGKNLALAQLLIERGADVNARDKDGRTALTTHADTYGPCSTCTNIEMAKLLLRSGATLDLQDEAGRTALLHAVSSGYIELVRELVDAGADKNAQDESEMDAIMLAAQSGKADILELLLQKGAYVRFAGGGHPKTFMLACGAGQLETVKILFAHGNADLLDYDFEGNSPLVYAIRSGNTELVTLLVAHGADPQHRNYAGETDISQATRIQESAARILRILQNLPH